MHFLVLSSSKGTVFRATLERIKDGSLTARCIGLIADRADRGCVAVAEEFGVPVRIVPRAPGDDREAYDRKLEDACEALRREANVEKKSCLLALMGWMFILSPWFVRQYPKQILNVHPSLLPKYPGAHAHDFVLAARDTESGMTIHYVDEGLDSGEIVVQKKCPVLPDDTEETLKARVQELEKEWFPKVLQNEK